MTQEAWVVRMRDDPALGRFAGQTLVANGLSITREHGKARRISGILYVPLYHPAAALHQQSLVDALEGDFRALRAILDKELGRSQT